MTKKEFDQLMTGIQKGKRSTTSLEDIRTLVEALQQKPKLTDLLTFLGKVRDILRSLEV